MSRIEKVIAGGPGDWNRPYLYIATVAASMVVASAITVFAVPHVSGSSGVQLAATVLVYLVTVLLGVGIFAAYDQ